MFKKIAIGLVIIVLVFCAYVSMQPDDFRVERSATFNAPAEAIFSQVNNLKNWQAWSPWAKLDPNAKTTLEGAENGTGAKMNWAGNSEVGKGSMTITESRPSEFVRFKLDFLEPMEASNTAEFTFKQTGKQTIVTWSMYGKNNFIGKAMGVIFNCDKMIGDQFESGFANLKPIVETIN